MIFPARSVEFVEENFEAGGLDEFGVGGRVVVTGPHSDAEKIMEAFKVAVAHGKEQVAANWQEGVDGLEELGVFFPGDVEDGVERDDGGDGVLAGFEGGDVFELEVTAGAVFAGEGDLSF